MKLNLINIILIVVFLFIILSVLLTSNTVVIPYTESTIFKKEFPYEGFSNYGNLDGTINSDSTINDNLISASSGAACAKVYGIDGLFCAPGVADKPIDKFSALKSSKECLGNSSGLSNSTGPLCLDSDTASMLKTRGGNAVGGESKIGK